MVFDDSGGYINMGAVIPTRILGLEGQVIKEVVFNEASGRVRLICDRDRRRRPVDHRTGRRGQVNRLLRRAVLDVPLGGYACVLATGRFCHKFQLVVDMCIKPVV